MKRTKSISYRVTLEEQAELNEYSKSFGGQKVDGILDAIRNRKHSSSDSTIGKAAGILTEIEELRKSNKAMKTRLRLIDSHPIMQKIMETGIYVYEGKKLIKNINDFSEFLDFVYYNSFKEI